MADRLARVWWIVLIRAGAAIIFGLVTIAWPLHTMMVLVMFFGAYALFDGLSALAQSARGGGLKANAMLALAGAVGVTAGLAAFARPRAMTLVLIGVLGAWLIFRGLAELSGNPAVHEDADGVTRRQVWETVLFDRDRRHWSVLVNGLMSVLFGVGLLVLPRLGALTLTWALGGWAILHGLLLIPYALSLRHPGEPIGGKLA